LPEYVERDCYEKAPHDGFFHKALITGTVMHPDPEGPYGFEPPGYGSDILSTDPDLDRNPSINNKQKNLDFYYFVISFLLFIYEN
jgi:hypothetical protein